MSFDRQTSNIDLLHYLLLTPSTDSVALIEIDKVYSYPMGPRMIPRSVQGSWQDINPSVPSGEVFQLRRLLNASNPAFDFNIHLMDFEPGQYLVTKEMHYNQHGLMMLAGEGIYRLGSDFMTVQAGDFIWMAPYCLQWYAALGSSPTRYFLYKDTRTDPLLHVTAPTATISWEDGPEHGLEH
jgi:(S)-ureidoglycine aminohydrolase